MKKSVKSLRKKLKDTIREYVRLRDEDTCQMCGAVVYGSNSHPSHVKPVSTHSHLQYDENNIKILCMSCHRNWHLDPTKSTKWFKMRFPVRFEYLEKEGYKVHSWKTWELEGLIEIYQQKIKERK